MHACKLRDILTDEEADFLHDALQAALEEGQEVLERHKSEEPPLFDVQTTGEAAEDYVNLIASQKRRIEALQRIYNLCEG